LQNLAFVEAWPLLDRASQATAKTVAQRNLEETVKNWQNDAHMFGPWEDVEGPSFFARAVQVKFLDEVGGTNTLGLSPPADFAQARGGLKSALDVTIQPVAGIQTFPLVSSARTSKGRRPCLAAVDR
jgi:hypothetical protein